MDPRAALGALRETLRARGVVFRDGPPTGRIVDCRGMAAAPGLTDLRAVRGEMLEVVTPEVGLTRTVRLLHPRFPCYIVPRGEGRYMIGATMVESADPGPITARAVMELLSAAYTVHPAFAEAEVIATGAGLRPSFPDNIPAIRREGDRIHVNGMYRHGFLMAPVLATTLVRIMTEEISHAH
jgi:glycine oxidase